MFLLCSLSRNRQIRQKWHFTSSRTALAMQGGRGEGEEVVENVKTTAPLREHHKMWDAQTKGKKTKTIPGRFPNEINDRVT
jgi:hypothetical protein